MKKTVKLLILLLLFSMGCYKDYNPVFNFDASQIDPDIKNVFGVPVGNVSMYYNGEYREYSFGPRIIYDGKLSIYLGEITSQGLDESISVTDIPFKVDSSAFEYYSNLGGVECTAALVLDGDGVLDIWRIDTSGYENYVQVTHINPYAKRVAGKFQARLLVSGSSPPQYNWPDTIEITEGRFYLEYKYQ